MGRFGVSSLGVLVASVVIAGLYSVFNMQSRQFVYQDLQMEMHQNLRFGTDMVTRSVRMAGYGTGGSVTGYSGSTSDDATLPVIMSWDGSGDNETDGITVVYGDPSLRLNSKPQAAGCTTDKLEFDLTILDQDDKISEYSADELLLCSDYANLMGIESYLWVIKEVNTSSGSITVSDNTGYSDYASVCSSDENLSPSMLCSKAHLITFYIDANDDGVGPGSADHPVLMMDLDMGWPEADDVPLVDNIEDLQLEYCLDDGTATTDCSVSTAWVDGSAVDATSQADNIWMVRFSMVARSSREDLRDKFPGSGYHQLTSTQSGTIRKPRRPQRQCLQA